MTLALPFARGIAWAALTASTLASYVPPPILELSAQRGADELEEARHLFRTGDYPGCLRLTEQALEAETDDEQWSALRVQALLETGRYEEALTTLKEAIEEHRRSPVLRYVGVATHFFNGNPLEARVQLMHLEGMARSPYQDQGSAENLVLFGRALRQRGEDPKVVLDEYFRKAKEIDPKLVDTYLATAELALDKHDYELAADELQAALRIDPENPEIHFLMARAFADSDPELVQQSLAKALSINPSHAGSLLLTAEKLIDSEQYEEAEALLQQVLEVNPHQWKAWALRAVLAHLSADRETENSSRHAALAGHTTNARVDFWIGKKLSDKYRFKEGALYQRRSLKMDAGHLEAKFQLAQDLLRLGQEQEGWKLAEEVLAEDEYHVVAYNLMTLHDRLVEFEVLEREGLRLRMSPHEASVYGEQALDLLEQAARELGEKYEVTLPNPVTVDIFPEQKDFAIRTFGLPGGAGFLGVCFGNVITANSPASRGDHPTNWQALLWHELCHVVTLQKTGNKMPRWLSEGISVYEERQRDPSWGERMNLVYRRLVLAGEAAPVSRLSSSFLHPQSPLHLQFAYYVSSMVVEYMVEEFGLDSLKQILCDLGDGLPIQESLRLRTGSPDDLDQRFEAYLRAKAEGFAAEADWSEYEPTDSSPQAIEEQVREHPDDIAARMAYGVWLIEEQRYADAVPHLRRAAELSPLSVGTGCAWDLLARAHRGMEDTTHEREALAAWFGRDDDALPAGLRLMEIDAAAGNWAALKQTAQKVLAIQPLLTDPYRHLARAALETDDTASVIQANKVLLALGPLDVAEVHFRLAEAYHTNGNRERARRHVLMALEEAPRFRDAHRLLLKIAESSPADSKDIP